MITVTPSKDKDEISKYFKKHSVVPDECSGCVVARCGEEVVGYCIYTLNVKSIIIHNLEPKMNLPLVDGVLRSALHVAAERSAMDARYSDSAPVEIFEKLGFILNREEKRLNINKLFGGCHCKK